jgi:seryl-tRNA synthetase
MLDVRRLRQEPELVRTALAKRHPDLAAVVDRVLARDVERRDALGRVNDLKARRNEASRKVGDLKRTGGDASELIAATKSIGDEIAALDEVVRAADADIEAELLSAPNTPLDEVVAGGEEANRVVSTWGSARSFAFTPRPHWEVGERLGILELAAGARISGSGFPVLRGLGARLQRGLIDWFLDVHTREHGYVELRVPYLVTTETMTGTGQLPKFAEDLYQTERDGLWLIPTAEVPVTNMHRDELLKLEDLPIRYTAYTPCFRREAGAAGKDTRGLLRVHQFDKVELVRYETPERSRTALEELTREAETLLERLGLHWRRLQLAAGDMGFGNAMTYDLEVWAPGVGKWLEVSSCSSYTDYQARRANLRFKRAQADKPEFVHTLNGSALALPRMIAALLETYQEEDGSVGVPEVLVPYVGTARLAPSA